MYDPITLDNLPYSTFVSELSFCSGYLLCADFDYSYSTR